MDIFRSDLNAGFKNKLFETEIEHVNDRNIVLENNTLVCELTSGKTKNGFKITGHLINNVVNDCDRCLSSYIVKDKLKIHFDIYNDSSSIDNRKDDILYWPSKSDSIDMIINSTEGRKAIKDSGTIRSSAEQRGIYCTTTIAGGNAVCEALKFKGEMHVRSQQQLQGSIS